MVEPPKSRAFGMMRRRFAGPSRPRRRTPRARMHPAVVLLLGCATAAAQDSLAVCDLNTDLPESLGTVNLKFSESVMVHNNLGGKGGKDAHNDDDPHEIRHAARPSPRLYPRSTNLTPALRRTRRLSNIARLQVLDAAIAAGMLPDAQVSCQAMWEAYGPIFFPGSKVRGTDSKFAFDWQQSCCPCAAANTTAVDPILGMTSEAWCTLAGLRQATARTSCAETMVTINQKHLYHVLNPTGATVDIGSDIVVTNRSEYDPKNPKANGIVLTNADDGSTGGLVQINVRTNTSVDMRMRTKPSCCLDLVSDGELSACEWWEAAPFDEAAFATLAQGVRPRTQGGDEVWLNERLEARAVEDQRPARRLQAHRRRHARRPAERDGDLGAPLHRLLPQPRPAQGVHARAGVHRRPGAARGLGVQRMGRGAVVGGGGLRAAAAKGPPRLPHQLGPTRRLRAALGRRQQADVEAVQLPAEGGVAAAAQRPRESLGLRL